jgi:hypothetical protein
MKKRVFRQIGGQMAYRKWKEWEAGDWLEGTLLRVEIDRKYKKPVYVVEVSDCGFSDTDMEEKFKSLKTVKLNATGTLNKALDGYDNGTYIRIDYNGMDTIESGQHAGADAHSMKVSVAEWEEDNVLLPEDEGEGDL